MFYFGAILLGLLAAGFVCWPLLMRRRSEHAAGVEHSQVVRDVYRDRVVELAGETEDDQLRAEIVNELGAVLLTEVQADKQTVNATASSRWRSILGLLALLIPVAGLVLYLSISDPNLEKIKGAEEVLRLGADDKVALESWSLKLSQRTARAPDDDKSWYLLGHTYLKLGRFGEAAEAFATTNKLAPEDLNIQIYWLQSRYLAGGGKLDSVSRGLAESILEKEPNIPVVMEILALDAFHRGAGAEAVTLLNRAMTGATDIRAQASFAAAIKQVRQGMQDAPAGVKVNVTAQGEAPPHGTVFVVARPIGGGMPYAVARRPAFLLPFTVTLDDLVSMSPTRQLSQASSFEVVVRLSQSGNAMAEAGDWQWLSQPLPNISSNIADLDALLTPP